MENATKALLIAAAILIAIIIISIGLVVVRQGQEAVASADMSEAEREAFNSKFRTFEGTNVSTSDVNALLSTVLSHNQNETEAQTGRCVTATVKDGSTEKSKVDSSSDSVTRITGSSRYTVTCELSGGLVTTIKIQKVGTTDTPDPE